MTKKTNDAIKAELARQDEAKLEPSLADMLRNQQTQIERALPNRMDADRFARIVLTTVKASPQLVTCTKSSIIAGCMLAAQLGLEPGPLGHSYLVPYWNRKLASNEAQFQIGYRGIIDLARRSGQLKDIQARTVFEGDEFEEEYGLNEKLVHRPRRENRGDAILYYLIVRFHGGGHYFRVEDRAKIEQQRGRSKAANNGPWVTDYEPMAWKTLVQLSKQWLPLTAEAAAGMALDGAVLNTITSNMAEEEAAARQDVIDLDSEETDAEQSDAAVAEEVVYTNDDPERPFD